MNNTPQFFQTAGAILREERKALGMTLNDTAVHVSCNFTNVSRLENGHIRSLELYEKMASVFDVTLIELLTRVIERMKLQNA